MRLLSLDHVSVSSNRFGFQVELVTYKWPNWLRAQTEKQRIIWGYKILFLDVLFPLNLTKVCNCNVKGRVFLTIIPRRSYTWMQIKLFELT